MYPNFLESTLTRSVKEIFEIEGWCKAHIKALSVEHRMESPLVTEISTAQRFRALRSLGLARGRWYPTSLSISLVQMTSFPFLANQTLE